MIHIRDLGTLAFDKAWEIQKNLLADRILDKVTDTLLLVEHPPVITKGRALRGQKILDPRFPVFDVERGGKTTYHGPGQLVGYPIVSLGPKKRIKQYVCALEDLLISTLATFKLEGKRKAGATGVWVGDSKIASIGIAVKKWVTYHGFALNVSTDLTHFSAISPCGFDASVMTSMENELKVGVSFQDVKKVIAAKSREFLQGKHLCG